METHFPHPVVPTQFARDRLKSDFVLLAADAETLLRLTAHDAHAKVREARARVKAAVAEANAERIELQRRTVAGVKRAVARTDGTVRAHPYRVMGIALGLGVLGVWLLRHR